MIKPLAAITLTLAALPAHAQRWTPDAGTRPYTIEVVERVSTRPDKTTRADFDLVTDGKGGATAIVRGITLAEGGPAKPLELDEACRTELAAQPGELARLPLAPLAPEAASTLSFIPPCVPSDLFMPIGEILRVTGVQLSPNFGLATLARPGDSRRFPAFASHIDRPSMKIDLDSGGGVIRFAKLEGRSRDDRMDPDPMNAAVLSRNAMPGVDIRGDGVARVAVRLVIDRKTGALVESMTTEDSASLMLDIKDAPPIRIEIARTVTVRPR